MPVCVTPDPPLLVVRFTGPWGLGGQALCQVLVGEVIRKALVSRRKQA